ncbi:MAG: isoprenylcysteine carboxylmethyltransferase family protein [Proteobacteria bacterium]|nr:MAG: isoprenylcysteine carboxylmethyltransferase family protein [Pseudomonadota bacterium]
MSPAKAVGYAIGLPLALLILLFLPAGSVTWDKGWIFVAVSLAAFAASAAILARVNPVIFRARSRFQPGTKGWDKALLSVMLPTMVAIVPIAAFDAGRMHWSPVPLWAVILGYAAYVGGIAITGWAQAVNPFFEPGVRIQSERHQRVIDTGPYRFVRHPGYLAAILMFFGMAIALASYWATIPAAIASALLLVRTSWEDRLLHAELPGYEKYAAEVRWRIFPGLW